MPPWCNVDGVPRIETDVTGGRLPFHVIKQKRWKGSHFVQANGIVAYR